MIKIEILVKNHNFVKNLNFCQKSKFWSKIEILVKIESFGKNRNFRQQSTFSSKILSPFFYQGIFREHTLTWNCDHINWRTHGMAHLLVRWTARVRRYAVRVVDHPRFQRLVLRMRHSFYTEITVMEYPIWFVILTINLIDAVFYRTYPLLYHKFANMVIFRSGKVILTL